MKNFVQILAGAAVLSSVFAAPFRTLFTILGY
jgi:hypothetical protein